mgnify:CR=1 FL=1
MRALHVLARGIGLRRIALLLLWLRRGAPTFSFLGLPASLELVPMLLNALTFLLAPFVALWLSLFAPHFEVAWSPFSVSLLLVALAGDVTLFWRNWKIPILLARNDVPRVIARQVERDFARELREPARQALATYRSRRSLRDTHAMHLALLDVARGDLETLRQQVEVAILDPREMHEWRTARLWPLYL